MEQDEFNKMTFSIASAMGEAIDNKLYTVQEVCKLSLSATTFLLMAGIGKSNNIDIVSDEKNIAPIAEKTLKLMLSTLIRVYENYKYIDNGNDSDKN